MQTNSSTSIQAFRLSEDDYSIILNNLGVGVFILNDSLKLEYCNQKLLDILRIEQSAISKLSAIDFIHPDYRQKLMIFKELRAQGKPVPNEHTLKAVRYDGNWLWANIKINEIDFNDKKCRLFTLNDVSDEISNQNQSIRYKKSTMSILESSNSAKIIIKDSKYISFYNSVANEHFSKYFDYKLDENLDISGIFRRSDWKTISQLVETVNEKDIKIKKEIILKCKNKLFRWYNLTVSDINYDSQIDEVLLSFEDITLSKEKEIFNNSKNDFFQSLLNSDTGLVLFALDSNYKYLEFNDLHKNIMKGIWGVDIEIGISMLDYILDEADKNKAKINFDKVLTGKKFTVVEVYGDEELERKYWENSYSPVYINNKVSGLSVFVRDISDQIDEIDSLKDQIHSLKSLNKNKDRFISIIAHDLKAPMTGFIGLTKILESEIENANKDLVSVANSISENAQSMLELLENLLEWTNSNTGKKIIAPDNINLNLITQSIFTLFKNNSMYKNIELVNSISPDIYAFADANTITTVIRNLVSNSIKFTKKGSVEVMTKIKDDRIWVYVKDSGVGMSDEALLLLQDSNSTFSTEGTNYEKGTGIGLKLCREFVEKNGGKLKIESKVGKGTTFYFDLPLAN